MNIFLKNSSKVTSYKEKDLSHSGGSLTPQDHVWDGDDVGRTGCVREDGIMRRECGGIVCVPCGGIATIACM